jgi:DNA-binding LacI/PurR family transcriptional regulator
VPELVHGPDHEVVDDLVAALPDAVLAFNDEAAAGLLHTLRARGVAVPGDVSVVGFDDSSVAALPTVSLTTVGQDADRLARLAVEQAEGRVEGVEAVQREVVVPPRLVVRGSTRAR